MTRGLERVYDPFLFPVLGTKESIKKGKTIFPIQLAVYIFQKYIHCRFIYLFVFRKTMETGMDPRLGMKGLLYSLASDCDALYASIVYRGWLFLNNFWPKREVKVSETKSRRMYTNQCLLSLRRIIVLV